MTLVEKEKYIQGLGAHRAELQEKINTANEKRRLYLAQAIKENTQAGTLDQAILTSVKDEASNKGFVIE